MKFTLSWLRDHLETEASVERIATTLSAIGLEVESVENRADALAPFRIGYVVEAVQHPNADRLRACKVDVGDGTIRSVVCGAPNARTGMKAVVALPGAYVPGTGITLKAGEIRGVKSEAMMCSARELGLGDVPLMCATEIAVPHALPRVLRLMAHAETPTARADIQHVYLRSATAPRR